MRQVIQNDRSVNYTINNIFWGQKIVRIIIYLFFIHLFFFIKAFLTFTYKIEIKKEKKKREKDKHTHTYIVQIEEYQAKHPHKAITAIQLPSM